MSPSGVCELIWAEHFLGGFDLSSIFFLFCFKIHICYIPSRPRQAVRILTKRVGVGVLNRERLVNFPELGKNLKPCRFSRTGRYISSMNFN